MRSTFKTNEELPATLSATDISKYLGISKANSYQLMNRSDFPIFIIILKFITIKISFVNLYFF